VVVVLGFEGVPPSSELVLCALEEGDIKRIVIILLIEPEEPFGIANQSRDFINGLSGGVGRVTHGTLNLIHGAWKK
jgi:hypothetical protein